jgi:hypothetical protein
VQCVIFHNINCASGYNVSIKIKIIDVYLGYILENILNIDSFYIKKCKKYLKYIKVIYYQVFKVEIPNIVQSYDVKL